MNDTIISLYESLNPVQRLLFRAQIGSPHDGAGASFHGEGKVWSYSAGDALNKYRPGGKAPDGSESSSRHGAPLFGFEGYSIKHLLPIPGESDYVLYAERELVLYTDLQTGQVLYKWKNPFTGRMVAVIPTHNEWRFFKLAQKAVALLISRQPLDLPGESYIFADTSSPNYYLHEHYEFTDPLNVKDGYYTSAEIADICIPKHWEDYAKFELGLGPEPAGYDPNWLPDANFSWVRFGPWLPFMCMDEESYAGNLVYHAVWHEYAKYGNTPQGFKNKMIDYFAVNNAQGLETIGLDGWKKAPTYEDYVSWQTKHPGRTSPDTGWSSFYEKVLAPLGMKYEEWCNCEVPPLPGRKV